MAKTRFEDLDVPDSRLVPILAAWVATLFLVPIAGAILHFDLLVTQLTVGLLGAVLLWLIWRWSRPRARSGQEIRQNEPN